MSLSPEERRARRLASSKKWDAANRDKKLAITRNWRAANPDRQREVSRDYSARRRKEDQAFRLLNLLRNRIRKAVVADSTKASERTLALVGCSIAELRMHIEGQFQDGMSWSNLGQWQLDHRTPCAAFDLTDPAQQRACFHYSNLQPLWEQDNKAKGSRWEGQSSS